MITRKQVKAGLLSAGALAGALASIWVLVGMAGDALDRRVATSIEASLEAELEGRLGDALADKLPDIVSAAFARFLVCDDLRRQRAFASDLAFKENATAAEREAAADLSRNLANVSARMGCEVDPVSVPE